VCSLDTWWFNALAALPLFLTQPLFLVAIRAVAPIAISTPNLLQLLSALLAAGLLTCMLVHIDLVGLATLIASSHQGWSVHLFLTGAISVAWCAHSSCAGILG
jgi:hypothetical protein